MSMKLVSGTVVEWNEITDAAGKVTGTEFGDAYPIATAAYPAVENPQLKEMLLAKWVHAEIDGQPDDAHKAARALELIEKKQKGLLEAVLGPIDDITPPPIMPS